MAVPLTAVVLTAFGHPGGLAKDGCHYCRSNCEAKGYVSNQRHCHDKRAPTITKQPARPEKKRRPRSVEALHVQRDSQYPGRVLRVDYEGFTVWLDCARRGAIAFRYNAQRDTGNEKRSSSFYLDSKVPAECQQTSTGSYKGGKYDRGHLVPANHLDASALAIKQSNSMVNILPQASNMNRGAWLQTEEVIECYRDIDELLVLGGVIWGSEKSDDYFRRTHGVATPDAFWKVIIRNDRVMSWLVPNSSEATRKKVNSYIVSVDDIERKTGRDVKEVPQHLKYDKPTPWVVPIGCDKG